MQKTITAIIGALLLSGCATPVPAPADTSSPQPPLHAETEVETPAAPEAADTDAGLQETGADTEKSAAEGRVEDTGLSSDPSGRSSSAFPVSEEFTPDAILRTCPLIGISNAPPVEKDLSIIGYRPFVLAEGTVPLAVSPTNGACLSSGFGTRTGRLHKGVDYQSRPATMIHAAATGEVLEAGYRDDYGNYVVMAHGEGVHTRYAHLAGFEAGIAAGVQLDFGAPLGMMGNTAGFSIPVHLHYEVLIGDYGTRKKSFGLEPVAILSLPPFEAQDPEPGEDTPVPYSTDDVQSPQG